MAVLISQVDEALFLDWLRSEGYSEETVKLRRSGLRHFARWYLLSSGRVASPQEITHAEIQAYEEYLWGGRRASPLRRYLAGGTIWSYIASVRAFMAWHGKRRDS